mmetsp:Transcript_3353/g.12464  ORF Transcript_3353/g.12464 Transcript_3353/m.12464 type:complete len:129 (+) Transcript_3353:775-1161(+)
MYSSELLFPEATQEWTKNWMVRCNSFQHPDIKSILLHLFTRYQGAEQAAKQGRMEAVAEAKALLASKLERFKASVANGAAAKDEKTLEALEGLGTDVQMVPLPRPLEEPGAKRRRFLRRVRGWWSGNG